VTNQPYQPYLVKRDALLAAGGKLPVTKSKQNLQDLLDRKNYPKIFTQLS
jgi:hypothetical protein